MSVAIPLKIDGPARDNPKYKPVYLTMLKRHRTVPDTKLGNDDIAP